MLFQISDRGVDIITGVSSVLQNVIKCTGCKNSALTGMDAFVPQFFKQTAIAALRFTAVKNLSYNDCFFFVDMIFLIFTNIVTV
ncbi:hypothetical protein CBW42_04905 [Butyricicoccus porcorum]|uniref:Uncharacterized protein n=1 Tax=Butyricicoccus porcorum TaxID=1945634 RepID=A0A252F575_9FIRM|nr:hypothetical protein CBW42_04905 [Butyricicoccus porcorum]